MEKKKINFIITCYNREAYWPHLKELLHSYKTIEPIIALAYNGDDEEFKKEAQVVRENLGLQRGEHDLITSAYDYLINDLDTDSDLFIKIGMDSWLCDENVIQKVFSQLSHHRVPYAGNYWNTVAQLSTDIFFCDIRYGNVLENLRAPNIDEERAFEPDGGVINENLECCMYEAVAKTGGNFYLIAEREPVHPDNRESCHQIGWTMSHDLQENIDFLNSFEKEAPMTNIENNYRVVCSRPSDINQLLPTIKKYAEKVDTVVEMGVRGVVSTWAFLAGKPKVMRSYDIEDCPNIKDAMQLAEGAGIDFEFHVQDVIADDFEIEETELLFIDTWHRYDQLKKELAKHASKATKYIMFHDTETFGYKDEEETDTSKTPQGLMPAIEEFLEDSPEWTIAEQIPINNGLTVLERNG